MQHSCPGLRLSGDAINILQENKIELKCYENTKKACKNVLFNRITLINHERLFTRSKFLHFPVLWTVKHGGSGNNSSTRQWIVVSRLQRLLIVRIWEEQRVFGTPLLLLCVDAIPVFPLPIILAERWLQTFHRTPKQVQSMFLQPAVKLNCSTKTIIRLMFRRLPKVGC